MFEYVWLEDIVCYHHKDCKQRGTANSALCKGRAATNNYFHGRFIWQINFSIDQSLVIQLTVVDEQNILTFKKPESENVDFSD